MDCNFYAAVAQLLITLGRLCTTVQCSVEVGRRVWVCNITEAQGVASGHGCRPVTVLTCNFDLQHTGLVPLQGHSRVACWCPTGSGTTYNNCDKTQRSQRLERCSFIEAVTACRERSGKLAYRRKHCAVPPKPLVMDTGCYGHWNRLLTSGRGYCIVTG